MSVTGQVLEKKHERPVLHGSISEISPKRLEVEEVIRLYRSIGRRNTEYFQWIHNVYSWICLPCVSFDYRKVLGEDKTKMAVFDVMLEFTKHPVAVRNR